MILGYGWSGYSPMPSEYPDTLDTGRDLAHWTKKAEGDADGGVN
jgi:hypothetical protein